MILQNIVTDYENNIVNSYTDNKSYVIPIFQEILDIKVSLESIYPGVINKVVFQLTEDQYGPPPSQKRIIINPGSDTLKIVDMVDLSQQTKDLITVSEVKIITYIEGLPPIV